MRGQHGRREPSSELDAIAHATIGAAIEVHRVLGAGFLETVYEEAMCVELASRGLEFARQRVVETFYKSHLVGTSRLDLVVAPGLIVELKAVPHLLPVHFAQLISYLRAFHQPLGRLINFQVFLLPQGIKRVVLST